VAQSRWAFCKTFIAFIVGDRVRHFDACLHLRPRFGSVTIVARANMAFAYFKSKSPTIVVVAVTLRRVGRRHPRG